MDGAKGSGSSPPLLREERTVCGDGSINFMPKQMWWRHIRTGSTKMGGSYRRDEAGRSPSRNSWLEQEEWAARLRWIDGTAADTRALLDIRNRRVPAQSKEVWRLKLQAIERRSASGWMELSHWVCTYRLTVLENTTVRVLHFIYYHFGSDP